MSSLKSITTTTEKFLKKNYRWFILGILGMFLIVSLLNAKNDSATFDEIAHIPAGYTYLAENEMRLNPEHPPLIKGLSAIPLLFMDLNFDTSEPFWTGELPRKWDAGQWAAGRHLLYEAGNDPDQIIFWSRVPIILISVLLGLFIFKWVSEIAGVIAGLFALSLYAFDPNILGHNHYVTTDIGIAAFLTFSFYYYIKFIKKPSWKNVALAGLFLGLLQLAKFSSITAFPIFALITIIYPLVKKGAGKDDKMAKIKRLGEYIGKGALVFLISLVVVWILYAFTTFNTTQQTMTEAINFNFSPEDTNPKNLATNSVLHSLNSTTLTRPLAEYGIGIGYVFRRVAGGNGAYFMGEVSSTAFPAYFPIVFLIKETIPFLLLLIFAATFTLFQIYKSSYMKGRKFFGENLKRFIEYLRTHIGYYPLFGFILLYVYLSVTGNLNIGFRHLFPILPFLFILVAKKMSDFIKHQAPEVKKYIKVLFAILMIWIIAEPIVNYPVYVSYFNQIAGGPRNGYHYVTDSNADWGQDLKRLNKWIDLYNSCTETGFENGSCKKILSQPITAQLASSKNGVQPLKAVPLTPIDKIRVDYFGGGNPEYYLGDKYIPWWDSKRPIESGWYAISTNFLQGSIHDKAKNNEDSYRWTQNRIPIYQVGTSILIYYVDSTEVD